MVDAFLSAARGGDFDALLNVLDPGVVARSDGRFGVRGAVAVASTASRFARIAEVAQLALINGAPGVIAAHAGEGFRAMTFDVRDGRIVEIDVITDPQRLLTFDLALLDA